MTEGHYIWQQCPSCRGTGVNEKFVGDADGVGGIVDVNCPTCDGDKYIFWGWMSKDNFALPDFLPDL